MLILVCIGFAMIWFCVRNGGIEKIDKTINKVFSTPTFYWGWLLLLLSYFYPNFFESMFDVSNSIDLKIQLNNHNTSELTREITEIIKPEFLLSIGGVLQTICKWLGVTMIGLSYLIKIKENKL